MTPDHVRWISGQLDRLTPAQWSDAFRAAGYSANDTRRYVARMQQKVKDGLAVGEGR